MHFTKLLQTRLLEYVELNKKLSDNQSGFRPGGSTSDHIFVIKSLVNNYLKLKNLLILVKLLILLVEMGYYLTFTFRNKW